MESSLPEKTSASALADAVVAVALWYLRVQILEAVTGSEIHRCGRLV
jgi:hypothetical protein